jgi:hypothetical protein
VRNRGKCMPGQTLISFILCGVVPVFRASCLLLAGLTGHFVAFLSLSLLAFTGSLHAADPSPNQLVIYPASEGLTRSADFKVEVRSPGTAWREVPVYVTKVAHVSDAHNTPQNTSFASFDFSGAVDVSVTVNKGSLEAARIRPLSYGIKPVVQGNTILFSLTQPRNLSVEINGDIYHNLQLFANPVEVAAPSANDPNVIYYGPGIHRIGILNIPSGKTVYLAGGALVQGQFVIKDVANVKILGRGIIDEKERKTIEITSAKNVEIDGLIVLPVSHTVLIGDSQNITISNIKSFSAGGNDDGIDVFCSSDITIDGVFMRNSDDCIAIYGHRWKFYGNVTNVVVKNSILWADIAHPILVGTHGDPNHPETLEDLQFLNLDILEQNEPQVDYQGCMSLNAGDCNLIRNVRFENIRVEDFHEGQLVNLRVMFNRKYNTAPGRGIENVLFKNITYNGDHSNISVIAGYDDARSIKDVTFENLRINERPISDNMPDKPGYYKTADMARFFVGEHVDGLAFRTDTNPPP